MGCADEMPDVVSLSWWAGVRRVGEEQSGTVWEGMRKERGMRSERCRAYELAVRQRRHLVTVG